MPWISLVVVILAILEQQLDHPQQNEISSSMLSGILVARLSFMVSWSDNHGKLSEEETGVLFCVKNRSKIEFLCIASHQSSSQYYRGGIYVSIEQFLFAPLS